MSLFFFSAKRKYQVLLQGNTEATNIAIYHAVTIEKSDKKSSLRSHSTLSSKIKNKKKNMTVLLCAEFHNISLNVLRPTFFNIYNLLFYALQISVRLESKFGQKLPTFPIF